LGYQSISALVVAIWEGGLAADNFSHVYDATRLVVCMQMSSRDYNVYESREWHLWLCLASTQLCRKNDMKPVNG